MEIEGEGCVPEGRGRGGAAAAAAPGMSAGMAAADPNQRHHLACQKRYGPNAQFDGGDSCECKDGFVQVPSFVFMFGYRFAYIVSAPPVKEGKTPLLDLLSRTPCARAPWGGAGARCSGRLGVEKKESAQDILSKRGFRPSLTGEFRVEFCTDVCFRTCIQTYSCGDMWRHVTQGAEGSCVAQAPQAAPGAARGQHAEWDAQCAQM